MKKIKIAAAALAALMAATVGTVVMARGSVEVYVNGQKIDFDVSPYIEHDRTIVPASSFCDKMGWMASWDENEKSVNFYDGRISVDFVLNSDIMTVYDALEDTVKEINIDVPAYIENGRIMVPVRALGESFGTKVEWDGENCRVYLTDEIPQTDYSNEMFDLNSTAEGLNVNDDTYTGFENYKYNKSFDDFAK